MKHIILVLALIAAPAMAWDYDSVEFEEHIEDVYENVCGSDADCVSEMVDRESY